MTKILLRVRNVRSCSQASTSVVSGRASAFAVFQLPSAAIEPTRKTFWPNVVVTVALTVTAWVVAVGVGVGDGEEPFQVAFTGPEPEAGTVSVWLLPGSQVTLPALS